MRDTAGMRPSGSALHHAILTTIVDTGAAPTTDELATRFDVETSVLIAALRALADDHGVVLHPHAAEVWVAHPFATAPTPFVVERGDRWWWSPCAWCSLGAAALLDDGSAPVTITTTLGAEGRQVTVTVADGALFDDEPAVDDWCRRHRMSPGDVQPVRTVWEFARSWYGRHLDTDWRKWTLHEAAAMFDRFGLTGDIWTLDAGAERF